MTDPTGFLTDGATPPPRVLTAAPSNLPVAVRLPFWTYMLSTRVREFVLAIVVGAGMLAAGIGLAFFAGESANYPLGVASIGFGLFFLIGLPAGALRQWKDGFSIGADHTGVYLRPMLDKNRVVFVAWEGVAGVYAARWHGMQLVVKPHDTVIEGQFALVHRGGAENRAGVAIAQRRRMNRLGSNIHAPIPGVDPVELLDNLRYQAAGRAPVHIP